MPRLLFIAMLILAGACQAQTTDRSQWKPGKILDEQVQDEGHGFRLVQRSVVNSPGSWEGVGHFSYLYYEEQQLCRCGLLEFSVSPSGRFALFQVVETGLMMLFEVGPKRLVEVTKKSMGTPQSFNWDEEAGTATVRFFKNSKATEPPAPLTVALP